MASDLWDINAVAWWGAGLSSILGATAIFDRFFKKPLPQTSYALSTSHEQGNKVSLINGTSVPIMIQHWEIFWGDSRALNLWGRPPVAERRYDDHGVLVIQPYSAHDWTFTGQQRFSWPMGDGQQLYVSLRVVGRKRPVVLHVYNPAFDEEGEPVSLRRLLPHALRPRPKINRG
jgi:hypothetical protein